jgi:hypothetical protein
LEYAASARSGEFRLQDDQTALRIE